MMKYALALSFALAAGSALAQDAAQKQQGAMKMSDAQCQSLWQQLNPTNASSVSRTAVSGHISDFSRADVNSDGNLSTAEFTRACQQGLVSQTAATGTGAGESGMSGQPKSGRSGGAAGQGSQQ